MSDGSEWPLDLIVRARRGELSTSEEQHLKQCLRSSPTLRVAHLVGGDFDRIGEVEPGDDEQVRRFVADAIRRRTKTGRGGRGPRRLFTGLLTAAFLLTGTTAFGWWRGWVRLGFLAAPEVAASSSAPSQPAAPVDPPPGARRWTGTPSADFSAKPEPEPELEPQPEVPAVAPPPPAPESSPPRPPTKPRPQSRSVDRSTAAFAGVESDSLTAEQLFSNGNRARREGQNARAIALFQQLQQRFPGSAEAQLSRLSLGRVWLAQGRAQQALEQFSSYLAGGGPLTEEALLGKARALGALGRFGEERAVWQTLQRSFPNSVYQHQAEERLRQLDLKARQ